MATNHDSDEEAKKQRHREAVRKWRAAHIEEARAYGRDYVKRERKKINERSREWNRKRAARLRAENPEKVREYKRKWNENNPDAAARASKKWRETHPELAAKRSAATAARAKETRRHIQYRTEHLEDMRRYQREWRRAHPEQSAQQTRIRRARKAAASGSHTLADIRQLFKQQAGRCATCKTAIAKSGKNRYHVDHVVPLCRGGENGVANLQILCPTCNLQKSGKDPYEWAREQGRLFI